MPGLNTGPIRLSGLASGEIPKRPRVALKPKALDREIEGPSHSRFVATLGLRFFNDVVFRQPRLFTSLLQLLVEMLQGSLAIHPLLGHRLGPLFG